jgi:hypothetical protein
MPNITSVTLTSGVPTAGTGTVGTLDNVTGTAGAPSVPVLTVQGVASGTAQPVSGTVASTQSGTWTVQPGNTANTTAWKVDGSAVTQPVSIATAPVLVAGSAIVGKVGIDQTTPGTTNLVSIGTNGTVNPQTPANWAIGTSTQNSASVANGNLALAQFNTTPTTITSGNMSPVQMDNAGNLLVNVKAQTALTSQQ